MVIRRWHERLSGGITILFLGLDGGYIGIHTVVDY